ncbi:MAG: YggT family protein [Alphaproteobacteria bacterium]|nr:YggT family protein [Alphaproteobacteria bacterium]
MVSLVLLIDAILNIYVWIVFVQIVLFWLVHFNVVNPRNRVVNTIGDVTYRLTEPVLSRIRRVIPSIGGIDLSPVILILAIYFLRSLLSEYLL